MDEMPILEYATLSVYPYALFTALFRPSAAATDACPIVPLCPPKSNGMIVQLSLFRPPAAPLLIMSRPVESGPVGVVPKVMYVLMPTLLALMIFIASIFDWSMPPVSGRLPSQRGLQVPSDSMNARVNHLIPVEDITVVGSCGLHQPKYSYGATAMTAGRSVTLM